MGRPLIHRVIFSTAARRRVSLAPAAPGIAGAFAQAPQQGAPPCFNEFMPLRTEAEKRADAIQAAGKRKAPIEEVCGLFKRFYEAEDKVVTLLREDIEFVASSLIRSLRSGASDSRTRISK